MKTMRWFSRLIGGLVGFVILGTVSTSHAALIVSFQTGEVFDGRAGARDGVGDELFNGTSSYFNTTTQAPGGFSGQAMAYFDISGIDNVNVSSATFSWDVNLAFNSGAPSSTSIYGMANDTGLSLDDYNKGLFISTVATTGFDTGDIVTIDVTSSIQSFSGDFFGIRLASNDPDSAERFMNMVSVGARLDTTEGPSVIPEPSTLALFVIGLFGLGFLTRRRVAESCFNSGNW